MAGNNPIGLFPVFFCMTTFIIVVFTAKIVKENTSLPYLLLSLKTLKGKYCQIFDNDNTVTYLKYNL